jgi:hypothetical protein
MPGTSGGDLAPTGLYASCPMNLSAFEILATGKLSEVAF